MSTWIYLQAFLDIALAVGFLLVLVDRTRRRTTEAWQREVAGLVDTLGELLVEVERVTAAPTPEPAPAFFPAAPEAAPRAEARATGREASPVAAEPPREAAPAVDPVLALARDGLETDEIARRLGRPVGEVALVLGLRGPRAMGVGA